MQAQCRVVRRGLTLVHCSAQPEHFLQEGELTIPLVAAHRRAAAVIAAAAAAAAVTPPTAPVTPVTPAAAAAAAAAAAHPAAPANTPPPTMQLSAWYLASLPVLRTNSPAPPHEYTFSP